MKANQKNQASSNNNYDLKPQSIQNIKVSDITQTPSKEKNSHHKSYNNLEKYRSQLIGLIQKKNVQNIQKKTQGQILSIGIPTHIINNKNLLEEQNQRLDTFQKFNFQQILGSKKLYKPITQINQSFTQSINKGTIRINQQKSSLIRFNSQWKFSQTKQKQSEQIQLEHSRRIKEIQQKKNKILGELKILYQDQQKLRAKQKFILLQKKSQHQFTPNHKNQQNQNVPPLQIKLPKKLKRLTISSPKSETQTKNIKQKTKSLPKSTFTEEQKKEINQIIKKKNQHHIKYKQKLQKLFDQLDSQQKELLEKEKLIIDAQRQKRKQQALQRLTKHKNSHTQYIMNSRQKIHTEPNQVKDNQFFSQNSIETPTLSKLNFSPKKNYSYINYQQIDQEKLRQQAQYSRYLLQKRKQQAKINFEEIKVHLKNYRQIKTKQTEIERQKLQNFKFQQKYRIKQIRQKYGFMTSIKKTLFQQQRNSIQKQGKQIFRKVNYQKKMKDYFYSIPNRPKPRSRSNIVQSRTFETNSERNIPKNNSKSILYNGDSFYIGNNSRSDKRIELKKQTQKINLNTIKIDRQKSLSNKTKSLSQISHEVLTKRKIQLKQNIQKKQRQMMAILKKEQSSFKDIKKALQIFHQLDRQNLGGQYNPKRKSHKKQVAW